MKYSILFLLSFLILGCDDPSLDDPNSGMEELIEPIDDLIQLSSIQVALNTSTNITRDITFNYSNNNLLNNIVETGNLDQTTTASYGNGNQLEELSIISSMQPSRLVEVTYGNDDTVQSTAIVQLSSTDASGITTVKTLFVDNQNRFNRARTTTTDLSGTTTQIEDLRFQYSQNFNVLRINKIDDDGVTIIGYSDFTYNFNNNPFTDMNDVIRLYMFDEFVPYSRFLPATRLDFDLSTGAVVLERSTSYEYLLNDEGFPISRELDIMEGGMNSTAFEFFNYRP